MWLVLLGVGFAGFVCARAFQEDCTPYGGCDILVKGEDPTAFLLQWSLNHMTNMFQMSPRFLQDEKGSAVLNLHFDASTMEDKQASWWSYIEQVGSTAKVVHDPDGLLIGSERINFETFAYSSWFGFLTRQMTATDFAALKDAHEVNAMLANRLYLHSENDLGLRVGATASSTISPADMKTGGWNAAHHTFFLTALYDVLSRELGQNELSQLKLFEIGGGYGNLARMAAQVFSFSSWTIVDMHHVRQLQHWFLTTSLAETQFSIVLENDDVKAASDAMTDSGHGRIQLVDSRRFLTYTLTRQQHIDVVIATHSWSEFSLETFLHYWVILRDRATYILFSTQLTFPSEENITRKIDLILEWYSVLSVIKTEGGRVATYIFKRRPQNKTCGSGEDLGK